MPRLIIGTNWFRGYSHTSHAKDKFIKSYQDSERVADILTVFMKNGVDAVLGGDMDEPMETAIKEAEQRSGHPMIRMVTPHFNITPGGPSEMEPEKQIAKCKAQQATFCMPHQMVTDALADRRIKVIRDLDQYTSLIRKYEMIPGLSSHMPEIIPYADNQNADVETYIQLYNANGFLMQVEVDWVMNLIKKAKKPVLTIKPLAAGRLMPVIGLTYVWNTIRDQDMVAIGTTTPDEAKEVINLSLDILARRNPDMVLQKTRSKSSLEAS